MLLCIYIIVVEVLAMDVVKSECVPRTSLRVVDEEMRLNGFDYLYCHIDNACQNSQSSIYYKCNVNGENCQKMFAYFFANNSVNFYGNIVRSVDPYYIEDIYIRMELENVKTTDDGIWKIYISSIGSEYECVNYNVTTYVRPKDEIRIIPFNVPTHKLFNLTCLVNEMRPAYRLHFEINGLEFRNGIQIDTQNGDTWNISYSVELVLSPIDTVEVQCFIDFKDYFSRYDFWAYSDKFVINPVKDNALIFNPLEETVIGCAIPMNFVFMGWTKNNISISKSNAFTETRRSEVRGFFEFIAADVNTAQYSELKFRLPSLDQGCDTLNEYSGDYVCEAVNTDLGNSFKSAARHVLVEYAPTLESNRASTYGVSTRPAANVIIVCPLCSNPPVEEYKWLKGNIQLGNERTLMIPYVTESSFGEYTCIATNRRGLANVTITIIKIVDSKAKLYEANINEKITLECALCDDSAKECNWELNGEQIHTGRFYIIQELTEKDYGEYLCTAVFVSGRTWMRIELVKPGITTTRSQAVQTTPVGETEINTTVNIPASERQDGHFPTTKVVAGFAVLGTVVVGLIVAITVLCYISIKRQRKKDDATRELSTNATTTDETPHIYEKINVTFGNNPVYENTHPNHASNYM